MKIKGKTFIIVILEFGAVIAEKQVSQIGSRPYQPQCS